jgi:hypothetical protein
MGVIGRVGGNEDSIARFFRSEEAKIFGRSHQQINGLGVGK